jgi:hypothetical protein
MRYSFIAIPHFGQIAEPRARWFESFIHRLPSYQRASRPGSPLSRVTDSLREKANADGFAFQPYHFTYTVSAAPSGQHKKKFLQREPLNGPFERNLRAGFGNVLDETRPKPRTINAHDPCWIAQLEVDAIRFALLYHPPAPEIAEIR